MLQETPADSMESLRDSELLQRFVDRQECAALEEIVSRHASLVFGVCWRELGHWQDAEDAFQATFAVLAISARKILKQKSLSAWLHGVAYRISLKMVHHGSRLKSGILTEIESPEESPLEQIAKRSDQEIIDEELHALPTKFRTVLILRYLESYSNQQIAEELQISITAVESRLKRGRKKLRQRLIRRGLTLAVFAAIVSTSNASLQAAGTAAAENLIQTTATTSLNLSAGSAPKQVVVHQLAQMEISSMPFSTTTKFLAIAVTLIFTATVGWLGVQRSVRAQGNSHTESIEPVESSVNGNPNQEAIAIMKAATSAQTNPDKTEEHQSPKALYAGELQEFKINWDTEGLVSSEAVQDFVVYYKSLNFPEIVGAYSDVETNSLVVVGPPESEKYVQKARLIRRVELEGIPVESKKSSAFTTWTKRLKHERDTILIEMAALEMAAIGHEDNPEQRQPLQKRLKQFEKLVEQLEQKMEIVKKYQSRVSQDDDDPEESPIN